MSRFKTCIVLGAIAVALMRTASAGGPVFWVGAGAPCNFTQLWIAVGAVPDGAVIRLASNQTYDGINVDISDKSLTIEGGWADCAGTMSNEYVTLTGAPAANAPVFAIGSAVTPREITLRRLRIEGGTRSGIELTGHVRLAVEHSDIDGNSATEGGGIRIAGVSRDETILDLIGVVVGDSDVASGFGNEASVDGGGIACHQASVNLDGAAIYNNHAVYGGGVALDDCALATGYNVAYADGIGSFNAIVDANVADTQGGGVHAANASALAFGPGSDRVEINANSAGNGGGVYLRDAGTTLDGIGLDIDDNIAESGGGAAVFAGATLTMHRPPPLAPRPHSADGVIVVLTRCDGRIECNSISGNVASDTTGAALTVLDSSMTLQQTAVRGNVSSNGGVVIVGAGSIARIENSLFAENDTTGGDFIRILDGSTFMLNSSTIAGNDTNATLFRLFSDSGANHVDFTNSIIWQPDTTILMPTAPDIVQAVCVDAHENDSIDAVLDEPGFVDAANGDYRLLAGTTNIDACGDPFAVATVDILGELRAVDLGPDHGTGDFDRGAYELSDHIFSDEFESPLPPF